MTDQFIAVAAWEIGKVFIHRNSSPDFQLMTEIKNLSTTLRGVSVAGNRILLDDRHINGDNGATHLHNVNGTKIADIDRQGSTNGSQFGSRVAIPRDDDGGNNRGVLYVYSSIYGSFV